MSECGDQDEPHQFIYMYILSLKLHVRERERENIFLCDIMSAVQQL